MKNINKIIIEKVNSGKKLDLRKKVDKMIVGYLGTEKAYYEYASLVAIKRSKRDLVKYADNNYHNVDYYQWLKNFFGKQTGSYAKKYFILSDIESVFASASYGLKDYNKSYEIINAKKALLINKYLGFE